MKVIATADWHIHEFSDFSKMVSVVWSNQRKRFVELDVPEAKPMNSRLLNILNGLCDMRDYAEQHNITQIINAGDVFHKRGSISVTAFNAVHTVLESFYRLGISMYIIAGNHDQVDSSISPETSIHTFKDIANIIEKPQIMSLAQGLDTVDLVLLPYSKDKKFVMDSLHDLKSQVDSKESILVAHLGINGGTVGSGMYMMSDEYTLQDLTFNKWKFVVLGHYHQPQRLAHNIIYAGTPVQNTFNDELPDDYEGGGYNGFFVLDTSIDNSEDKAIEFVPIKAPRYKTVQSVDDMSKYSSDTYFRVKTSSQDVEQTMTQVEEMPNVRVEIEKEYEAISRSSIGLCDTLEEAVRKYAQENYHGDNPDILNMGLKILHNVNTGGGINDI